MAATVVGASPVTFTSEDTAPGNQIQIPLTALTISGAGAVGVSATWSKAAKLGKGDGAVVTAVLTDLQARGVIATSG